jgi:MYXO-CTERM domain-containing protein
MRVIVRSLLVVGILAGQARAQAGVHFVGTTQGCFAVNIGACVFGNTATLGGLTYSTQPWALQTDLTGFAATGNPTNGFGQVALTTAPFNYVGNNFFLRVAFSPIGTTNTAGGPSNATAGTQPVYSAILRGAVVPNQTNNGVTFNFGGVQSHTFSFTSTAPVANLGGTLVLRIFNTAINAGDPAGVISGDIQILTVHTTPEPATSALLAGGLLALAGIGAIRRRNRSIER